MLVLVCMSTSVRGSTVDDIRVVIDVSGSMAKTDPDNLRAPALRMLNGLIPTGSKAGVWTFGRYVNMEVKWGSVNAKWRKQADSGARKIHSRGQFTNIESALNRTTTGWEKTDKNTRRSIILLTDGKVDISKNAEKNASSKANILSRTIPQLVKKGVQVHTIALSSESDENLLRRIALDTSGSFEIAHSADDLQRIFLRMFERAARPDTVPIKGNKFNIDKSIREMTLLVFRKGDRTVNLIQPDGKQHSRGKHSKQVSWRNDLGYDLITVTSPLSGEWTLDADIDESNRVMIVTDLKLAVDKLPAYSTPDRDLQLKVELHNENKKISKNSFLKFVEFKVDHKLSDAINSLPLELKKSRNTRDKGIYLQQLKAPLDEGSHEIIVSADARTFKRNKRFIVEVQWPVIIEIDKTKIPGTHRLSIQARPEHMQANTLKPEVKLEYPDGQLKPVVIKPVNNKWLGDIKANEQNGLHRLKIHIEGKSIKGEDIEHELHGFSILGIQLEAQKDTLDKKTPDNNPDQTTSQKQNEDSPQIEEPTGHGEDGADLMDSIILILIINGVLILVATGVYFYLRKKKQQDDFNLMDEDKFEVDDD